MPLQPAKAKTAAQRRGVLSVLTAIALVPIAILCMFAVNVAYMQLVRTELRRSSDAAARAGARTLSISQDSQLAIQKAKDVALLNPVAGTPLGLKDSEIQLGNVQPNSGGGRMRFSQGGAILNAMRVHGQRTQSSTDGPVNLFAAGLMGTTDFQPILSATAMQYDRDIALVIDRSSSMAFAWDEDTLNAGEFGQPRYAPAGFGASSYTDPWDYECRWINLANAVNVFLQRLQETRQSEIVSMSSFDSGPRSRLDVPLTSNYQAIRDRIDHYTQGDHYWCSTNIGSGMEFALDSLADMSLRRPFAQPVMVVLTDGFNKQGPSPLDIAQTAASRGIILYTISFSREAGTDLMEGIAAIGNGKHYLAITPAELTIAFEEIANTIPTLLSE